MATIVIDRDHDLEAGMHLYIGRIAMSNSYVTGGELLDAAANTEFDFLSAGPFAGYVPSFDQSTQKLRIYQQKDPAAAGGANIALVEVTAATDLSTLLAALRFFAVGA